MFFKSIKRKIISFRIPQRMVDSFKGVLLHSLLVYDAVRHSCLFKSRFFK